MASEPRLITIVASPYNELGRWSLERAGVAYREEPKPLILHALASRRVRGKGTTPVLVADGEVVPESAEIAEWADRHRAPDRPPLYPEGEAGAEARRLVEEFSEEIAVPGRRLLWGYLRNDLDLAAQIWSQGLTKNQQRAQPWLLRVAKPTLKGALGLSKENLEAAPGQIRAAYDRVADRLADGRRHLFGDELTIADISFAAMSSPALCPPDGHPVRMPQPDELSEEVAGHIRELRAHPAGEYALRLYRDERPRDRAVRRGPNG